MLKRTLLMMQELGNGRKGVYPAEFIPPKSTPKAYVLSTEQITQITEFATEMSTNMLHRTNRSGGSICRSATQVRDDVIRGKCAEMAVHKYLEDQGNVPSNVDFRVLPRGQWDDGDITCGGVEYIIKSTKSGGRLLLIETESMNMYVGKKPTDVLVFVSVCLNKEGSASCNLYKPILWGEVIKIIERQKESNTFVKKGFELNSRYCTLDADNYFIHVDDLAESV